jgi:hypothetical protein
MKAAYPPQRSGGMMSLQGEFRIVQLSGNPKQLVRDFVRLVELTSSVAEKPKAR